MHYKVLKVYNNNVVLAEEPGGKQIVLIGKGVGFGARKGDLINGDDPDNKVFSILDESVNPSEIKRLNYDIKKVEKVTQEIVEIAREKLDITNDKLYDALYDHIAFAIERLKMGLPIDNPFIGEIAIMCSREFEVAEIAAKLIRREVDVDIGEPEKGFIALHLYSARRNKHINTAMKNARFYKQAVLVVGRCFGRTFDTNSSACKNFLTSLNRLISSALRGAPLEMPVKQYVRLGMGEYYRAAQAVSDLMKREIGAELSEDHKAFLAVHICLLVQM